MAVLARGTYPIIPGRGHGKTLGAPTLNFDTAGYSLSVATGIYAGTVTIDGIDYPAAIHYGPRPMIGDPAISLEAHLISTNLDQTPASATLTLLARIREIRTFPDEAALARRIQADSIEAQRIVVAYTHE